MTPFLVDDLKRDEGLSLKAYPDPLTKGPPWTIGYGHCGPEVHEGLIWSMEQAETALSEDVAEVVATLDKAAPWWRTLSNERQDVLANMCFNMGWGDGKKGLSGFHNTLQCIQGGDYVQAAENMLESLWARQVKGRATRLAEQMKTGVRKPRAGDVEPPKPEPLGIPPPPVKPESVMSESKPRFSVDLDQVSDDLKPWILLASGMVAWQMHMPEWVWSGLMMAALTMLKVNVRIPGK